MGVGVIFLTLALIIFNQDGKTTVFYGGLFNWVVIEVNNI